MASAPKTAAVITIGDEVVTGRIVNTNAAHLSRFLLSRGYYPARVVSVRDDARQIARAVKAALKDHAFVITTGGLGPTHDDITKKTLCRIFKSRTEPDRAAMRWLKTFYKNRGRSDIHPAALDYAHIPHNARAFENPVGAAPGLLFEKRLLALPGIPAEMKGILERHAAKIPRGGYHYREAYLKTGGIGETGLMDKMQALKEARQHADIAFLPFNGRVNLRIVAGGATAQQATANLRKAKKELLKGVEQHLWGQDDDTLEGTVGRMLAKKGKTLATAESCTGGWIGQSITAIPGSSAYFKGGVTAYDNTAKEKLLQVPEKTLIDNGAVSEAVAKAMAMGARKAFGSDYAVATTGIAGPDGGTPEKPVGLIYLALSGPGGEQVKELRLGGTREQNRERSAFEALWMLYKELSSIVG